MERETRLVSCSLAIDVSPLFALSGKSHKQTGSALGSLAQLAKKQSLALSSANKKKPFQDFSLLAGDEARLGFAPRSQSFAFVPLAQYAQSVRYPDFTSFHPSANPPNSITKLLATIYTKLERIGKILSSLISGRRGSNSRHPPWQGGILPLNYPRLYIPYYMLKFLCQANFVILFQFQLIYLFSLYSSIM